MKKIKIKYCGLTTVADVEAAETAGVDAIGLVFVKKSPRYVNLGEAQKLAKKAKQSELTVVALFADSKPEVVLEVIAAIEPHVLQFHGSENASFCEQFKRPYWKAVPMLAVDNYQQYLTQHPNAQAYLLDAFGGTQTGGSGQSFEWFKFPDKLKSKLILAGGIEANNIQAAIAVTETEYIDTSSGIEISPGVKSKAKMLSLAKEIHGLTH